MKKLLTFVLVVCSYTVFSQDATVQNLKAESSKTIKKDPNDTIQKTWKTGGLFSLNLAQGSLSNWAAGGDKFSISINTFINAFAYYKKGKNSWDNNLDFYLGYINTTSLGTRKNDDRIEYLSKYGYALNKKLDVGALFDIRSQFFKGYNYPDANTKVYTSDFFAPAYIIISPGFDYHPVKNLTVFVSPATARFIVVRDTSLSKMYGVDEGKKSDFQFGAYASIGYKVDLNKIVSYSGKLDLFSNYKSKPQNVDMYMTNLFAAKISKILSVTYSLTLIYDDDVRLFGPNLDAPRMQLQSLFGAGLLVKL